MAGQARQLVCRGMQVEELLFFIPEYVCIGTATQKSNTAVCSLITAVCTRIYESSVIELIHNMRSVQRVVLFTKVYMQLSHIRKKTNKLQ